MLFRPGRAALATTLLLAASALPLAAEEPDVASAPPRRAREDAAPGGVPFDQRLAEIQRRIQAALVYPPLARKRELEGESSVSFAIAPGGQPAEIELVRSSGSAVLDAAAKRAVRDAAPLPPVLGRLVIPVRFELHAD